MNRSNAVGAALLIVGLLLGGLIVERAGAQARTTKIRTWPPEPQDIVNLRGTSQGLDDGDIVSVFTVPNDRWLILNDARLGGYGQVVGSASALPYPYNFALVEEFGGIVTEKVDGSMPSTPGYNTQNNALCDQTYYISGLGYINGGTSPLSSVVGLAFRPGSTVRIRYANPSDPKGDAAHAYAQWNLIGYLTDR